MKDKENFKMLPSQVGPFNRVGDWPIFICLLGTFRLLKAGQVVTLRNAGKTRSLLSLLAVAREHRVSREALLDSMWPDVDISLASQSLNNLVYLVRKLLSDHLHGAEPVSAADGYYQLNVRAGIGLDITRFEELFELGQAQARAGDRAAAVASYTCAAELYQGDLCGGDEICQVIERERLRALYLTILARLAGDYKVNGDCTSCLKYARQLLSIDPCREDAHRLVMRCNVQLGERAQALRQYRLCETLLEAEFGAAPEAATRLLFDQIRLEPEKVAPLIDANLIAS